MNIKITKDRIFPIIKFISVLFLFFNAIYIPLIFMKIVGFRIINISDEQTIILGAVSNIILLIILFLIYRKDLIKEIKIFKNSFGDSIDCGLKYWLIGLGGMVLFNIIIQFVLNSGQAANEQLVQQMIKSLPWLMLINAGIIGPIIEELCFSKSFYDLIKNKWLFVILSAFIFGALHVVTGYESISDLLFILPYTSLGVAFALMYHKTKSVCTPAIMHIIHNTALVLISIFLAK